MIDANINPVFVLRPSFRKKALLCAFSAGMSLLGLAVLVAAHLCAGVVQGVEMLVRPSAVAAVFFGACSLAMGFAWFRRSECLRLEESALVIRSLFYEVTLRWEEIASFAVLELPYGKLAAGYRLVHGAHRAGLMRLLGAGIGCDDILPSNYGLPAHVLCEMLQDRLRPKE